VVDDYAKMRAAMVRADRAALEAVAEAYCAQKAAITEEARKKGAPPVLIGFPARCIDVARERRIPVPGFQVPSSLKTSFARRVASNPAGTPQ